MVSWGDRLRKKAPSSSYALPSSNAPNSVVEACGQILDVTALTQLLSGGAPRPGRDLLRLGPTTIGAPRSLLLGSAARTTLGCRGLGRSLLVGRGGLLRWRRATGSSSRLVLAWTRSSRRAGASRCGFACGRLACGLRTRSTLRRRRLGRGRGRLRRTRICGLLWRTSARAALRRTAAGCTRRRPAATVSLRWLAVVVLLRRTRLRLALASWFRRTRGLRCRVPRRCLLT